MIGFRNPKYERSEVLDQKSGAFRDQGFRVQRFRVQGLASLPAAERAGMIEAETSADPKRR